MDEEALKKATGGEKVGEVTFCGLQLRWYEEGLKFHQKKYIRRVFSKNGLEDCNRAATILPNDEFHEDQDEEDPTKEMVRSAQKAAGKLQWLSTTTRPDVTYSVQLVSASEAANSISKKNKKNHLVLLTVSKNSEN